MKKYHMHAYRVEWSRKEEHQTYMHTFLVACGDKDITTDRYLFKFWIACHGKSQR